MIEWSEMPWWTVFEKVKNFLFEIWKCIFPLSLSLFCKSRKLKIRVYNVNYEKTMNNLIRKHKGWSLKINVKVWFQFDSRYNKNSKIILNTVFIVLSFIQQYYLKNIYMTISNDYKSIVWWTANSSSLLLDIFLELNFFFLHLLLVKSNCMDFKIKTNWITLIIIDYFCFLIKFLF